MLKAGRRRMKESSRNVVLECFGLVDISRNQIQTENCLLVQAYDRQGMVTMATATGKRLFLIKISLGRRAIAIGVEWS